MRPTSPRRFPRPMLALGIAGVGIFAFAGLVTSSSPVPSAAGSAETIASRVVRSVNAATDRRPRRGDGYIATGEAVSPFAHELPAISKLRPGLRAALQRAARDAAAAGVELLVTSGWRSAEYQRSLMDDAVRRYGSRAKAERFVLTPERSEHVRGAAVDVGRTDAAYWLGQHGTAYGLCQTYANESWHFELATEPGGVCPLQLADATGRAVDRLGGSTGPADRTRAAPAATAPRLGAPVVAP